MNKLTQISGIVYVLHSETMARGRGRGKGRGRGRSRGSGAAKSSGESGSSQSADTSRQLYWYHVRISIDFFCDKENEYYHEDFKNLESIEANVVPKLLQFLRPKEAHMIDSRIVKGGCFQLEATHPNERHGKKNYHFQMVWNLNNKRTLNGMKNLFQSGFAGKEP